MLLRIGFLDVAFVTFVACGSFATNVNKRITFSASQEVIDAINNNGKEFEETIRQRVVEKLRERCSKNIDFTITPSGAGETTVGEKTMETSHQNCDFATSIVFQSRCTEPKITTDKPTSYPSITPITTKEMTSEPVSTTTITTNEMTSEPTSTTTNEMTSEPFSTTTITTKEMTSDSVSATTTTTQEMTSEPISTTTITTKEVTSKPVSTTTITTNVMTSSAARPTGISWEEKYFWVKIPDKKINYTGAEDECKKDNGRPANIYDAMHYESVTDYVRTQTDTKKKLWLGMTYDKVAGKLKLRNGTEAKYKKWRSGHPKMNGNGRHIALEVKETTRGNQGMVFSGSDNDERDGVICEE